MVEEIYETSEQKLKDFLLNLNKSNISSMTPEVRNKYEYAYEDMFTQGIDGNLVVYLHKIDDTYIATILDEYSENFHVMKVDDKKINLKETLIEYCVDCLDDPIKNLNNFKINPSALFNNVSKDFEDKVFIIKDDPIKGAKLITKKNEEILYSEDFLDKAMYFKNAKEAQNWIDSKEYKGNYLIISKYRPYSFNPPELVM